MAFVVDWSDDRRQHGGGCLNDRFKVVDGKLRPLGISKFKGGEQGKPRGLKATEATDRCDIAKPMRVLTSGGRS